WDAVVLTDSNRDRAHHWRSSQDVSGMTGTGGPDPEVLRPDEGDARFDLDGTGLPQQADAQTVSRLLDADGTVVSVLATTYGRPFVHLPERRAAMAVDGDPDTAWTTAEGTDPVGEALVVSDTGGALRLLQPTSIAGAPVNRRITSVEVETDSSTFTVGLDERSLSGDGQPIELPPGTARVTIRISSVSATEGGTVPSGVGFAELGLGVGVLSEVVRLPEVPAGVSRVDAVVMTRLRVGPSQQGRTDPEPVLRREFSLPDTMLGSLAVTVSPDTTPGCRDDLLVVDGAPVPLLVDGTTATACDGGALSLSTGVHRIDATGPAVERVVIDDTTSTTAPEARVTTVDTDRTSREVSVTGCSSGCWLVLGEGWNTAWSASVDGSDLGVPLPLSGGNGWWLPSGSDTRTVHLDWTAQGGVDLGLLVSAIAVVLCLVVLVRTRRPTTPDPAPGVGTAPRADRRRAGIAAGAAVVATAAATSLPVAALALVALVPAVVFARPRIASLLAWAGVSAAAAAVVARQVVRAPAASPLWPLAAERLHRPVLMAVIVVAAMAWADDATSEH
ncbi:MAG: hypothetical protein RJB65_874, partial [Actinomycetota bacterium]